MLFHILLAGLVALLMMPLSPAADAAERIHLGPGPVDWQGDLSPIASSEWSYDRAAHLLERAGFGGTPGGHRTAGRHVAGRSSATPRAI